MKVSGFGCLALIVGTNCGCVLVGSVAAIGRGLGSLASSLLGSSSGAQDVLEGWRLIRAWECAFYTNTRFDLPSPAPRREIPLLLLPVQCKWTGFREQREISFFVKYSSGKSM